MVEDKLLSRVSKTVATRIREHLATPSDFTERLHEFDSVYLLDGSSDGRLTISFAKAGPQSDASSSLYVTETTRAELQHLLGRIATLEDTCQPGYQITLRIDTKFLQHTSQKAYFIDKLASLSLHILGAPLRRHLKRLASRALKEGPLETHWTKPHQVYHIKPRDDSVVVIFPVHYLSDQDAAIGHTVLSEIASEAKRNPRYQAAPTCTYHPCGKAPPSELSELQSHTEDTASTSTTIAVTPDTHARDTHDTSYIRFTITSRQACGLDTQVETLVWSMTTFHTLLSYQIKACKAMIRCKMRTKLDTLLQELPPPQPTHLHHAHSPLFDHPTPHSQQEPPDTQPTQGSQGHGVAYVGTGTPKSVATHGLAPVQGALDTKQLDVSLGALHLGA